MLYLIGLGLGDARDITVRGLDLVKSAHKVFLESYTSLLPLDKSDLVCDPIYVHVVLGRCSAIYHLCSPGEILREGCYSR